MKLVLNDDVIDALFDVQNLIKPQKLIDIGYRFKFQDIDSALDDLIDY